MNSREIIARRVAQEFQDGDVVNLGIGIPTLAANYLPEGVQITRNRKTACWAWDLRRIPIKPPSLTDAGGNPVTILPGGCFFDGAVSFGLIRGGHVDKTVLGAFGSRCQRQSGQP